MVAMYNHTTFNLNPRATSIDTPLHGYIPFKHVDHMHPNAVISVAACKDQVALTQEIFGDEVGYVGWQRPGFDLGLKMRDSHSSKKPRSISKHAIRENRPLGDRNIRPWTTRRVGQLYWRLCHGSVGKLARRSV